MKPSEKERPLEDRLKEFVEWALKSYSWDYDVDGGDLQDKAEELCLIEKRKVPEDQRDIYDGEEEVFFPIWSPK